jgi:hyperpolarization activated cyclic nucleotide-gated potassium channel 2
MDELSQASDADDDFDDRYIHLIAAHSEINKAWGVIYPDSTFKGVWDLFVLLFIIYQAILIPFRLCFDVDATGAILIVEDIMDVSFMVDICITFNTGFYKKGYLVMKRKDIIKNYFKTWFWIDLVASFPYTWVLGTGTSDSTTRTP